MPRARSRIVLRLRRIKALRHVRPAAQRDGTRYQVHIDTAHARLVKQMKRLRKGHVSIVTKVGRCQRVERPSLSGKGREEGASHAQHKVLFVFRFPSRFLAKDPWFHI